MTQAHTPGPWHLVSERRSEGNKNRGYPDTAPGPQILICGPAGATVITRRGLAKPGKTEGKANARLIAAAPDMLAALIALRSSHDTPAARFQARYDADAAISKAMEEDA